MSRIGKQPIPVPSGVKVEINGRTVKVEGPKGKLSVDHHHEVKVSMDDGQICVDPTSASRLSRSLHGTTRQLLGNMVQGVTEGFEKKLEIRGVGYNAKLQGKQLILNIGFCHTVDFVIPEGIEVVAPAPTQLEIKGADKQKVGQFAANIRRVRPPEPYKGKGIRYVGEYVAQKATKAFGK